MNYTSDDFPNGTIITGTFNGEKKRTIYDSIIFDGQLHWNEGKSLNPVTDDEFRIHSWPIDKIKVLYSPKDHYEIY